MFGMSRGETYHGPMEGFAREMAVNRSGCELSQLYPFIRLVPRLNTLNAGWPVC